MRRPEKASFVFLLVLLNFVVTRGVLAQPYNATSYGVVADAVWGISGCLLSNNPGGGANNEVGCTSSSTFFSTASVGKTIIIDTAGASGASGEIPAPDVDTIMTYIDGSHVVLEHNAVNPTIDNNVTSITVDSSGGYNYAFNTTGNPSKQQITCSGCGGYLQGSPKIKYRKTTIRRLPWQDR